MRPAPGQKSYDGTRKVKLRDVLFLHVNFRPGINGVSHHSGGTLPRHLCFLGWGTKISLKCFDTFKLTHFFVVGHIEYEVKGCWVRMEHFDM